jgi:hypothetical protein
VAGNDLALSNHHGSPDSMKRLRKVGSGDTLQGD